MSENKPAPTWADTMGNPGAYEGTSFDPTLGVVHPQLFERFSGGKADELQSKPIHTFADWYKYDPEGALAWLTSPGQSNGIPLNIAALGPDQRRRMGLAEGSK